MKHHVFGRSRLQWLLLPMLLAASSTAQSTEKSDLTPFLGMWKLLSFTQRFADGTARQAPISEGYIVYSDAGRMCFVGMNPDRPKWNSLHPTEAEAWSGIVGLGAYCASVEVHPGDGYVLHHVDIERVPNNVGMTRKRWYKFDGPDRLTLTIDAPELSPPQVEGTLVWERVGHETSADHQRK